MPTPEFHDRTISTDTRTPLHKTISTASAAPRTLYTASIPCTHFSTIPTTILHRMKIEKHGFKRHFVMNIYSTDNIYKYNVLLISMIPFKPSHFCIKNK